MSRLSSTSTEGLSVRINTEFQPAHREFYAGRAHVVLESGDCTVNVFPTGTEMRILAADLIAAADQVEA